MADWSASGDGQDAQDYGRNYSTTTGTAVLSSSTNLTKGSWVQLASAIAFDAQGILVHIHGGQQVDSAAGYDFFTVDIGVGASSSEVVLIPDLIYNKPLAMSATPSDVPDCLTYYLPISIPKSTRVSARCQSICAGTGNNCYVSITILGNGVIASSPMQYVETIGLSTGQGTSLLPGSSNTKTSYSQMIASTPNDYAGIILVATKNNMIFGNEQWYVDLAIGSGGNEIDLLANMPFYSDLTGLRMFPVVIGPFPVHIPKGTRISTRCQTGNFHSGSAIFVVAYGIVSG